MRIDRFYKSSTGTKPVELYKSVKSGENATGGTFIKPVELYESLKLYWANED